jgi:DNA-binding MarR family transcriptional regulator
MSAQQQPVHGDGAHGLDPLELTAWRTFLRAHAQVLRRLEADLLAAHDLPLASYDVLVQLSEAPERQLRMTELAERVLLSRSGLTRLVDRLERDGLVTRQACPSDARGTLAVLTERGLDRLREAWPTHARGVKDRVTGRLSPDELRLMATLLGRLVDGDAADGGYAPVAAAPTSTVPASTAPAPAPGALAPRAPAQTAVPADR